MNNKLARKNPLQYLKLALSIACCLLSVYLIAEFFETAITYWQYPSVIDYGEGCVLTFMHHLLEHGTYFFPLNDYPFSYATYPPLFMALSAPLSLLSHSPLQATRFLSTLATIGTGFVLFLIIHLNTKNRLLALWGTAAFFGAWFLHLFAPLGRVDTLVTFFSVLGLLSFQKHSDDDSPKKYLAFFFFACAFFTKQSAIFAPASIFIYVLIRPNQRRFFLKYLFTYAALILLGLGTLAWHTQGEALRHLFFYTSERTIDWFAAMLYTESFLTTTFFLWLLSFLSIPYLKPIFGSSHLIYVIYLLLNAVLIPTPAATSGNINYFIDPLIALVLFSSIAGSYWIKDATLSDHRRQLRKIILLLCLLSYFILSTLYITGIRNAGGAGYDFPMGTRYPWISREYQKASQFVRETKGDILCEDLSLLVLNHKPVLFGCSYPPAERGIWNPEKLVQDCENQRFEHIISLTRYPLIPKLKACIANRYELSQRFGFYFVYSRKKTSGDQA